jgi:hypothetical protein
MMRFRRYAVELENGRLRKFWTLTAAKRFRAQQATYSRLCVWLDGDWWPAF